jgi:hypothetical protein
MKLFTFYKLIIPFIAFFPNQELLGFCLESIDFLNELLLGLLFVEKYHISLKIEVISINFKIDERNILISVFSSNFM